jgi:hypothetical protein
MMILKLNLGTSKILGIFTLLSTPYILLGNLKLLKNFSHISIRQLNNPKPQNSQNSNVFEQSQSRTARKDKSSRFICDLHSQFKRIFSQNINLNIQPFLLCILSNCSIFLQHSRKALIVVQ